MSRKLEKMSKQELIKKINDAKELLDTLSKQAYFKDIPELKQYIKIIFE